MSIDIYRRQARNLAWYDQDGEPSSHNPFKKFRRRPQRTNSVQLEDQAPHSRSLGDLRLSQDQRRRAEFNGDLEGPAYSGTFPPESAGSYEPAASNLSQEPINDTADKSTVRELDLEAEIEGNGTASVDTTGTQARQRKGFFGKFGHKKEQETSVPEPDDEKPLEGPKFTVASQIRATVFNSWINVLIIAAPVGIALHVVKANPIAIFVVNFIAIIPLAAMLSYATEEIALRTGETIGGLLNASFGNAVELIVAIIALVKKEVLIVQTSLIGSILSNLLLVMGMCFFFGGVNRIEQHFNVVVAQTAASLLALAVASLIIPTAFHKWSDGNKENTAPLSRGKFPPTLKQLSHPRYLQY
jgi:Ca2+:H+ antiporter